MKEIHVPNIRSKNPLRQGKPTPHGMVRQIPEEYKNLPVVSAIRAPLERMVSLYQYGDWKKQEAVPVPIHEIKLKFPRFPELNLLEFVDYLYFISKNCRLTIGDENVPLGTQSWAMIDFYYPHNFRGSGQFHFTDHSELWNIFNNIIFLDSSLINIELHNLLLKFGYHKNDLSFLVKKGKVNVSKKTTSDIDKYFIEKMNQSEWIVNHILKQNKAERPNV